jgi:hypothetical protein
MTTGGSGGGGGTGGGGSGGGGTGGGGSGGGGTGGMMVVDAGDPYTCFATQMEMGDPDPGGTAMADADCCGGLGTCTPRADITDEALRASLGHAECSATPDLACAPKDPSMLPDGGVPPSCHIDLGQMFEGRCLPDCFVLGNPAASNLNAGDCAPIAGVDTTICAPCFDPTTGDATGACTQNGDMPAEAAPTPFAECGAFGGGDGATPGPAMGLCVPEELAATASADATLLPVDTCGTGELCAPKNKVTEPLVCFAKCTTLFGVGACVADYIIENNTPGAVAALGDVPAECVEGEHCAPCELSPGMPTGACAN